MAGGKLISTGVEFPDATTQTTSGLPLTGGTMTGALTTTGFTSTGIDDNATSTAITIDASENVGIGTVSPDSTVHLKSSATNLPVLKLENTYESGGGTATVTGNAPIIELYANDSGTGQPDSQELGIIEFRGSNKDTGAEELYTRIVGTNGDANTTGELKFETQQSNTMTTALTILGDRGLSQFTAKAWVNINGTGTVAIRDSHNVSSVTDSGTGNYLVNFSNDMGNANYSVSLAVGDVTFAMNHQSYWLNNITTASFRMKNLDDVPANYYDPVVFTAIVFGD